MIINILITTLFMLGFWGLLSKKNILKKLIALNILNNAVIILFIKTSSRSGISAPILVKGTDTITDPLPQALMLTAIVIGMSITAFGVCLIYRIYQKYGTLNLEVIEREHIAEHK
ncbi:cation:proton antiporter subunit C [Chitinispirillales bacterium ANBcel5]|uniref:sodium:proton antiporter n=1 Tax=Cellulosispirillum alkaliphilum TaxID=3039283 RepID=UPI002A4E8525|nr:cation:proton antiporter subunit C [Chitinispirillales bacterium ANBcel5]